MKRVPGAFFIIRADAAILSAFVLFIHVFFAFSLLSFPRAAFSWLQESEFKNGRRAFLHWPRSAFPLKVTLSLPGTGDIEGLREFDAVRRAIQQWDHLPTADVPFQLGLRGSPEVNASDRINTIVFREDADPSLVAKTIVTFVTSTGEILDADVVFNEKFSFRMDRPSPENPQLKEIFLEDVAVHELGHLLGGAHSPTYLSSMWFATLAGQSFTDRDDRALVSHLYPKAGHAENRIGGKITDGGGKGFFGAVVSAIQTAEGGTLGEIWSAITDVDGTYVIEGVVDGEYLLIVQPLYGSLSNLYGKYYGTTQNPGGRAADGANSESDFKERYFDRNSSSLDSLFLEPVVARGGMSVVGVDLSLTSPSESISDAGHESNNTTGSATPLRVPVSLVVGKFNSADGIDFYSIPNLAAGDLVTARVVAYPLRSPLDARIKVFEGGSPLPAATSEDIAAAATRFQPKNLDPLLLQHEVTQGGTVFLAVERVKPLSSADFSGGLPLSGTEHYLLSVRVTPGAVSTFGEGDLAKLEMQEDQPAQRTMREGGIYGIDLDAVDWGIFEEIFFRGAELNVSPRKDQGDVTTNLVIFRDLGGGVRRWGVVPVAIAAVNDAPTVVATAVEIVIGKTAEFDLSAMFADVESNGGVGGLGTLRMPFFRGSGTGSIDSGFVAANLFRRGDAIFVSATAKRTGTIGEPVQIVDAEGALGEGLLTFRVVEPAAPAPSGDGGGWCGRLGDPSDWTVLNIGSYLLLWLSPFVIVWSLRWQRRRKRG